MVKAEDTGVSSFPATTSKEKMEEEIKSNSYPIDSVASLNPEYFPHSPPNVKLSPPSTIQNLGHMLKSYSIVVRYDVIKKKLLVTVPGLEGSTDNADNVALSYVISLASLNKMSTGHIPAFLEALGDRNLYNPAAVWITSRPWDGVDRLQAFYDTLVEREGYPKGLKEILIYRWALSAVAASLKPSGFRSRGVLTLAGPQSIGKTTWISLLADPALTERLIKLDHHLDASNKDSTLTAIGHWIVEIGELDSSFKRDIARLKGFLTATSDKIRKPYGRGDSEYSRRTVFCATVNEENFLVDMTGNTRWWTIPVTAIDTNHGIDMQQLFAQLAVDYHNDKQWWLTREEEQLLEEQNKLHQTVSVIRESILENFDLKRIGENGLKAYSASELLRMIGFDKPTNPQCREYAAVLRELLGDHKRINGINKWRVPYKGQDIYAVGPLR